MNTFLNAMRSIVGKIYTTNDGLKVPPEEAASDIDYLISSYQPGHESGKFEQMILKNLATLDDCWPTQIYLRQRKRDIEKAGGIFPTTHSDKIIPLDELILMYPIPSK